MATWSEFANAEPDLAAFAHARQRGRALTPDEAIELATRDLRVSLATRPR